MRRGATDERQSGELMAAFLDMRGKICLVVGGGHVGTRRAMALESLGASVRVVSPTAGVGVQTLAESGRLVWQARAYESQDALGCALVIVATDDPAVNDRVTADAKVAGAWVNAAFEAEAGDFRMPASFTRGGMRIAVGGVRSNPRLVAALGAYLQRYVPMELASLEEWCATLRAWAAKAADAADAARRRRCLIGCTDPQVIAAWLSGDGTALDALASSMGAEVPAPPRPPVSATTGPIHAVGGGGPHA